MLIQQKYNRLARHKKVSERMSHHTSALSKMNGLQKIPVRNAASVYGTGDDKTFQIFGPEWDQVSRTNLTYSHIGA